MATDHDRTQVAGRGASYPQAGGGQSHYPAEPPTEVVGGQRASSGPPYRSDVTMVAPARRPDPSFAWLVVTKGRRLGDILSLRPDETSIGRETDNDVIVDDEYCSRRHAKIRVEPDEEGDGGQAFFIYDLATNNGTFVNGEQTLRTKLVDGTKVQIGETVMVFKKV